MAAYSYTYANDTVKKILLFDNRFKDAQGNTVYKQLPCCLVYFYATDGKTRKGPFLSPESTQKRIFNSNAGTCDAPPTIDIIGLQMMDEPGRHYGRDGGFGHFYKGNVV